MFSFGELHEWTHPPAFKARWMRLHARSELGVAVQNQKRLLASPTTPELLKCVVDVHFKYFCRCALRPRALLRDLDQRLMVTRHQLRRGFKVAFQSTSAICGDSGHGGRAPISSAILRFQYERSSRTANSSWSRCRSSPIFGMKYYHTSERSGP